MKYGVLVLFVICHFGLNAQIEEPKGDSLGLSRVDSLLHYAEKFLGRPYGFGSVGPSSFDCSGYVQFVYGRFGVKLPHGSVTQSGICKTVAMDEALPGDLIFFNGRKRNGQIGHVALVHHWEGDQLYIIHATVQAGVLLESMNSSTYFQPRFIKVGRLINGLNNVPQEVDVNKD
jgi:murein DD-endopeptidase / murein LD-carboxypeptidase